MKDLLTADAISLAIQSRSIEDVAAEVAGLVAQRRLNPETDISWRCREAVKAMLVMHRRAQAGEFLDLADFFREIAAGIPKWTGAAQNDLRLAGFESVSWFERRTYGTGTWASGERVAYLERLVEAYADKHQHAPKRLRKGRFTVYFWPVAALQGALGGQA